MQTKAKPKTINMPLSSAISLLLLVAVLAASVPSGLSALHSRMETVLCANNLRGCTQAWSVYASEFDGKYIARRSDFMEPRTDLLYTMWYYVKGISLPGPAFSHDPILGLGWFNPETLQYGGFSLTTGDIPISMNPQYHCPTKSQEHPYFPRLVSFSNVIWRTGINDDGEIQWRTALQGYYPKSELFTHPSTTLLIQDMTTQTQTGQPGGWASYHQYPFGTHHGKDNFAFVDGHVELLTKDDLTEDMFRLYYTINE